MTRRWSKPWGAAIGFALLAAYVVIPEGNKYAWDPGTFGYLVGTGTGAGLVGAAVGWFVCALQNRRSRAP